MPIYEYECITCNFQFEKKQKFHEEPVAKCPKCQGEVRRILHAVPVIFKGGGFYITDNRKADAAEPVKEPAKGEKETPSKKKSKVKQDESSPAASH